MNDYYALRDFYDPFAKRRYKRGQVVRLRNKGKAERLMAQGKIGTEQPTPLGVGAAYTVKPGGWYEFADGAKVRGKAALEAELARRRGEG